jgi:hypothetical protein
MLDGKGIKAALWLDRYLRSLVAAVQQLAGVWCRPGF